MARAKKYEDPHIAISWSENGVSGWLCANISETNAEFVAQITDAAFVDDDGHIIKNITRRQVDVINALADAMAEQKEIYG